MQESYDEYAYQRNWQQSWRQIYYIHRNRGQVGSIPSILGGFGLISRPVVRVSCGSSWVSSVPPSNASLTHSWRWARLEKPPIVQLLKNFPAFYGIRRFITRFTWALRWFLSSARSIQSIPSDPSLSKIHFNTVTHLHLGLPSGHFPSGSPTNILYAFLFAPFVIHVLSMLSSLTG
jgi:hypothetical protein